MTPRYSQRISVAFVLNTFIIICISAGKLAFAAEVPTIRIDRNNITIKVGKTQVVQIESSEVITTSADDKGVKWTELGDLIEVETKINEDDPKKATSTIRVKRYSAPKEIKVSVNGSEPVTVTVTPVTAVGEADFPADQSKDFSLKIGDPPKKITIQNYDSQKASDDDLSFKTNENIVAVERTRTGISIGGRSPSKTATAVTIISNGQPIATYNVVVTESIAGITLVNSNRIELSEGREVKLSTLPIRIDGNLRGDLTTTGEYPLRFDISGGEFVSFKDNNSVLRADHAPRADQKTPELIVRAGLNEEQKELRIPIIITAAATTISLSGPPDSTVYVNKPQNIYATVRDSLGIPVPGAQIEWSIPPGDSTKLVIANQQDTQATVVGSAATEGQRVRVIATLKSPITAATVKPSEILLDVKSSIVTGFAPLQIRVDLLDSQTAKDLFGKKAADENYIAKIRLFNKLKNQNGEFGDSILVYSESLEIRVQLELKDKRGGGDYVPLPEGNKIDMGKPDSADSYWKFFGEPAAFPADIKGTPPCSDSIQPNFVARYRPYTFDIVANTHDRRDERSLRSRILTFVNSASSLASFVTSVAVPGTSNDTRLGLDQFKGLLVPSFEKLFPSMKEVQRQNIISMVMRPLEEIPFGSDITRIIFIPKGRLYGMVPDKIFRIGGVSTTGACAEVGIVKKAGSAGAP